MPLETLAQHACFGGTQKVFAHQSQATGTRMEFAVYLPPQAKGGPCPVVYYLSGLTCTWENATTKAGAQRLASELGLILVFPDTSPRGEGVANDQAYDLGQGASFYLDAMEKPWAPHFRMESYVVEELPALIEAEFSTSPGARGVTGHSMGGHGALTLAMRHKGFYRSLSAFAPIVNPTAVPWGEKAFAAYLGPDKAKWQEHDACALLGSRKWDGDILVDVGEADPFLERELKPERLEAACQGAGVALTLRRRPGYDHSYYFISTFIADHLRWHAERLGG